MRIPKGKLRKIVVASPLGEPPSLPEVRETKIVEKIREVSLPGPKGRDGVTFDDILNSKEFLSKLLGKLPMGGEGAPQYTNDIFVKELDLSGESTYTISQKDFSKKDTVVYHIEHDQDLTVYLPRLFPRNKTLYIKDVTGNANTYPITIQLEA